MATESTKATDETKKPIPNSTLVNAATLEVDNRLREERPWKKDHQYFTKMQISGLALIKILAHARCHGNIEIMGLLTGLVGDKTALVSNSFALPGEGTETRVNAMEDSYGYMVSFIGDSQTLGCREVCLGWYHSHPDYGCWLSGIDVGTQRLNQQFYDPYFAIVVDPIRSMASGKVQIGGFRSYPEGYTPAGGAGADDGYQSIPHEKIADFGVHANAYYSLPVQCYATPLDRRLLRIMASRQWPSVLSGSSLHKQRDYFDAHTHDLITKLDDEIDRAGAQHRTQAGSAVTANKTIKAADKLKIDAAKFSHEQMSSILLQVIKNRIFNF